MKKQTVQERLPYGLVQQASIIPLTRKSKKKRRKKVFAKCVHKNHQSFGGVPESCGLQALVVLSIKHFMTEGGIAKWPKAVRAALENNGLVIMDSSGIYGNKT